MALSNQFLVKGIDFTGFATAAASDFNNLVDLGLPKSDSASEGKGLTVWTKDSALDTPIVPDATLITTFKRCSWIRVPHSTATSKVPFVYSWNDDSASDPTYLKWSRIEADLSSVEADITALDARVDTVEADVASANATASNAAATAATAIADSATALATANTALANAAEAASDADAAQQVADSAFNLGTQALAAANAAQTTANTALANSTAVAANKFFTSAQFALVAGSVANTLHNLGGTPKFVRWVVVCINAAGSAGYTEDDEVDLSSIDDNANNLQNFQFGANATSVFLAMYNTTVDVKILHKTTGAITNFVIADWEAKCYAWL